MDDELAARFLQECGGSDSLRIEVRGPAGSSSSRLELGRPWLVIGRDPEADLVLDDPLVSRRHAYWQLIDDSVYCVDLQSRTGLRWPDGARLQDWADSEASLGIGPFWLRDGRDLPSPKDPGSPWPTSRTYRPESEPKVEGTLEFLDSARPTWRISRTLVLVGRSRRCRVRLQGAGVSGIHCSLVRTAGGFWVVDLLSKAGTVVNEDAIRQTKLEDGDILRLGNHRLRFRSRAATMPPSKFRPSSNGSGSELGLGRLLPDRRPEVHGGPGGLLPAVLSGTSEHALEQILWEVGRVRSQDGDPFRDALLLICQMFAGMHREQMDLIREQLARIDRLDADRSALDAQAPPPANPPLSTGGSPSRPSLPSPRWEALGTSPEASPDPAALHEEFARRLKVIQAERNGLWGRLLEALKPRERP